MLGRQFTVPTEEVELTAIRAQGAGGQHVNKTASAIHLRFNIHRSSLSPWQRQRLLGFTDKRINKDGNIIIKAQQHRSQEKNRRDAMERLQMLIDKALTIKPRRIKTTVSKSAKKRRTDQKTRRGQLKSLRGKVSPL